MRRFLAISLLITISGVFMAASLIGFCARMSCCSSHGTAVIADVQGHDCCTTINCSDSPAQKLTSTATVAMPANVPVLTPLASVASAPQVVRVTRAQASPPSAVDRLAQLSTLLI